MRKQNVRTRLSEIGMWLLIIISFFFIAAPYFYLRVAVVHLVRWLSRTPKLILLEKEDRPSSVAHWLRQEIERLIPIGSSLVRAEKILKRNGFKVSKEREEGRHYLDAVKYKPYVRGAFFLVYWTWDLTLDYEDGYITAMNVHSYIDGL